MVISTHTLNPDKTSTEFFKSVEKPNKWKKYIANTLSLTTYWELRANLGTRLKFPDDIVTPRYIILLRQYKESNTVGIDSALGEEHAEEGP